MMNKRTLIESVSEKTNFTLENSETAVDAVIKTFIEALSAHERIIIHGFGTFKPITRSAHNVRNVANGELMTVPTKRNYKFICAPELLEMMNEGL